MSNSLTLPVIHLQAANLAEGWERAVVATWERGARIATQYDKPDDPPSRDATLVLSVADPFAEPRIHRALPGGIYDLEVYRQEVVDGIHDDWIDPEAGKWPYTYHERLRKYAVVWANKPAKKSVFQQRLFPIEDLPKRHYRPRRPVDQLEYIIDTLARVPHSRRAQAVLWMPQGDPGDEHPPCLQRLWCRVFGDQLVMSAHIRSNDAYKAAYMNMYAFTELQKVLAEQLSNKLGRLIRVGQYNHIVDSFHIYGSYFEEFEGFLQSLEVRTLQQRTFTMAQVAPLIEEARERIAQAESK